MPAVRKKLPLPKMRIYWTVAGIYQTFFISLQICFRSLAFSEEHYVLGAWCRCIRIRLPKRYNARACVHLFFLMFCRKRNILFLFLLHLLSPLHLSVLFPTCSFLFLTFLSQDNHLFQSKTHGTFKNVHSNNQRESIKKHHTPN